MKTGVFLLIVCLGIVAPAFAQPKEGTKLPQRVTTLLAVESSSPIGSPEYDKALLKHFAVLDTPKEVFGYVCARAEREELIVRAQWFCNDLVIWFGAFEDGMRVECDLQFSFTKEGHICDVQTAVLRFPGANDPEGIRSLVRPVEPPPHPEIQKSKTPNKASEPTATIPPPAATIPAPLAHL